MQNIFVLDIKDVKRARDNVVPVLSENAVLKAESYADDNDRLRSLGGALLIKAFTAKGPLFFNERKKPYKNEPPYFNVSHSGDKVGIFLSDEAEVGLDVQKIKEWDDKLINYAFSEEEKKGVKGNAEFTKLWTMKEAAAKCIGTGLFDLKRQTVAELTSESFIFSDKKLYYKSYELSGYFITACSYSRVTSELLPITVEYVLKTLANR